MISFLCGIKESRMKENSLEEIVEEQEKSTKKAIFLGKLMN